MLTSRRLVVRLATGLIVFVILDIIFNPVALRRLHDFVAGHSGQGVTQVQLAELAIRSGGAWGQRFMGRAVGYAQIPVAASDFAFAQMVYLFGAIPGAMFLLCFWLLLDEMLCPSAGAADTRNENMVCAMYLLANGALCLLSNVSIIPTVGVPCPFLSRGGTAIATASIAAILPVVLSRRSPGDVVILSRGGRALVLGLRVLSASAILCVLCGLLWVDLSP